MSEPRTTTRRPASAPAEQPVPPRPALSIKGSGAGLRVVVRHGASAEAVRAALADQLARQSAGFFAGAVAMLELPGGATDWSMVGDIDEALSRSGIRLAGVQLSGGSAARVTSPDGGSGMVAGSGTRARTGATGGSGGATDGPTSVLVQRTLRSGQRLAFDGDVTILGDVNAGAEVVAGGSVIVWGRLRGTVEAGLDGDPEAVVAALDLAPTQLRIGNAIARAPEEPDRKPEPETARAVAGRIVVDAWQ